MQLERAVLAPAVPEQAAPAQARLQLPAAQVQEREQVLEPALVETKALKVLPAQEVPNSKRQMPHQVHHSISMPLLARPAVA
jgi:hypothetical protein